MRAGKETVQIFNNCLHFYLLILERREGGGERIGEGNINLLFYLCIHSLIDSCICLTGDRTCNLGIMGQCSNQLSYPCRARNCLNFYQEIHWGKCHT